MLDNAEEGRGEVSAVLEGKPKLNGIKLQRYNRFHLNIILKHFDLKEDGLFLLSTLSMTAICGVSTSPGISQLIMFRWVLPVHCSYHLEMMAAVVPAYLGVTRLENPSLHDGFYFCIWNPASVIG